MVDLSEAVCVYLGAGPSGGYQPAGSGAERLKQVFGPSADALAEQVSRFLVGPEHSPRDWESNDLQSEQSVYEAKLRAAFPELSARAINALACRWSYGWR